MDPTDQATCLCYSSPAWVPNEFNGAVYTGAQYAATSLPASEYSDLAELEGFCSDIGNVETRNSPATESATMTPIAKVTPPVTVAWSLDIFTNYSLLLCGICGQLLQLSLTGFHHDEPYITGPMPMLQQRQPH